MTDEPSATAWGHDFPDENAPEELRQTIAQLQQQVRELRDERDRLEDARRKAEAARAERHERAVLFKEKARQLEKENQALTRARDGLVRKHEEAKQKQASLQEERTARVKGLQGEAAQLRKEIATQQRQTGALQRFVSQLAIHGWPGEGLADALYDLHATQPSLTSALCATLMESEQGRRHGLRALIRIQHKRRLYGYVVELADRYPEDSLVNDCFAEAAHAYAVAGMPRAAELVRQYLARCDKGEAGSAQLSRFMSAFDVAVLLGDRALMADVLRRAPAAAPDAVAEGETSDYALARRQAEIWLEQSDRPLAAIRRTGAVCIGVLGYNAPLQPSTNIGDYVQTLAMMGLMARSLPADVRFHGGGQERYDVIAEKVARRADAPQVADAGVDAVWIDRDDPATIPQGEGPVWLPVNAWFMHPQAEGRFGFPFAPSIRPIFTGMHINQPQMLTPEAIAYLKKYAPIGARDYHTAELLMANGVDAFFSGCPTLTLDGIFGRAAPEARQGRLRGVHRPARDLEAGRTELIHMHPDMAVRTRDENLAQAWAYLEAYARAEDVETPLLHCYLPCRAMGTPVRFTHGNRDGDVRFEGLIDIDEAQRSAIAGRIRENTDAVLDLILSGASEDEVYRLWRERNAAGVAEIRARMAARQKVPAIPAAGERVPAHFPRTAYLDGAAQGAPAAGHAGPEIVLCFDRNFYAASFATIRSLHAHTQAPLRITLLTRDLTEEMIIQLSRAFPKTPIAWLDVTEVRFDNLNMMRHTTLSTMDRLFLPQFLDYADKVLYLDIDLVALADIDELYSFDLGEHAIGARATVFPGWSSGFALGRMIEKQLDPEGVRAFRNQFLYSQPMGFACFNAGVQLLDLKRLREENFTGKLLQIVDTYGVNDQFACNLFAAGDFVHLPNEWNHFPSQEWIDTPKLIHYTGYIKPWNAEYSAKAELWRQYVVPEDGLVMEPAIAKSWFR